MYIVFNICMYKIPQLHVMHNNCLVYVFLDAINLPATLQCTDNDLSYLERMANIKLVKEFTVSTVYSHSHTLLHTQHKGPYYCLN